MEEKIRSVYDIHLPWIEEDACMQIGFGYAKEEDATFPITENHRRVIEHYKQSKESRKGTIFEDMEIYYPCDI